MAGFWAQLALVAIGVGVASDNLPAGFVDLADVAPDVVVDMRTRAPTTFSGGRCAVTAPAAAC